MMRGQTVTLSTFVALLLMFTASGCVKSLHLSKSSIENPEIANDKVQLVEQASLSTPVQICIENAGRNGNQDCVVWFRVSGSPSDEIQSIAWSVAFHTQSFPARFMNCSHTANGDCVLLQNVRHHGSNITVVPEPDGSWLAKAEVTMHDTPDPIVISMNPTAITRSLRIFHERDFEFDEGEYLIRTGCSMLQVR